MFCNLLRDDQGGAIVEYALFMALASMLAMTALIDLGGILSGIFSQNSQNLRNVAQYAK